MDTSQFSHHTSITHVEHVRPWSRAREANVRDISAMLLYVTERDIGAHALPKWWAKVSDTLVDYISDD